MLWVQLTAAALLLVGFLVMAAAAIGGARHLVAPWRRRGIDPHLWGFHLMGMGIFLELLFFLLDDPGWGGLSPLARGTVGVAVAWIVAAGGLALGALVPPHGGRRRAVIPPPNSRARSWPPAYRLFLGIGFASLLVLALLVLTTP